MGYRHDRPDMLAAGIDLVLEEGLHALSFGRLAKRLGIADRTVVYYFPTKADLVGEVAGALGARLQGLLDEAFGTEPSPPDELARRAWPVLATDEAEPVFRLFFELVGLSAAGLSPYRELATAMLGAWVEWLAPRIDAPPAQRRDEALALVARIDGLLLVRRTLGIEAADGAARVLFGPAAPARPRR